MQRTTERIEADDIATAFSLLPDAAAQEAMAEALRRNSVRTSARRGRIKWADFDLNGAFLRGGSSSMTDRATAVVSRREDDEEIRALSERASSGELAAGLLEIDPKSGNLLWFVPFTPSYLERSSETMIRGISVTEAVFGEILLLFNSAAGLTKSEKRVAFQIVAGTSLRTASDADGVSIETKRSQLKSACAKLCCAGQNDLVRKILGQMVYLLSVADAEGMHARTAEAFIANYLADDVRAATRRLPNGRLLRFVECGPRDGMPVLMIHGMMWPIILVGIRPHLEATGLRLIVPIRRGHLEFNSVQDLYGSDDLVDGSMADIALFLESSNEPPITVVGNSLGAVLATGFANRYPHLVSKLILLSINLTRAVPTEQNPASPFYASLNKLSKRHDLFKEVHLQYRKYYAQEDTCRHILRNLFGSSDVDLSVLDGDFCGTAAYRMFSHQYQASVAGMVDDYIYVMRRWNEEIARIRIPTTFIHGTADPLTEISEFSEVVAGMSNTRILPVQDGGHFVAASNPAEIWAQIARIAGAR